MSRRLPEWTEAASGAGPVVPRLAVAAIGRSQTAYRRYLDHAHGCADCVALDARCDAAKTLWAAFREERGR
jgi:hypothetical protein